MNICVTQLAGAVEYTNCISAEELDLPSISVLLMTLNHGEAMEYRIFSHCCCLFIDI